VTSVCATTVTNLIRTLQQAAAHTIRYAKMYNCSTSRMQQANT